MGAPAPPPRPLPLPPRLIFLFVPQPQRAAAALVARGRSGTHRGCEDPKRGAQDPDPNSGLDRVVRPASRILRLPRQGAPKIAVRWGAQEILCAN